MYITATGRALSLSSTPENYVLPGFFTNIRHGTSNNDVFYSAWGETLLGGAGDDSYYLWQPNANAVEKAGEGIDTVYVQYWGGITLSENIENAVLQGFGCSWATGNALDNILIAGITGARLDGGAGNDVLVSGIGADIFHISRGNGSDAIVGFQSGWDTILLNNYGVKSWTDLSGRITQTGNDVSIDLANGEKLVLRDTVASSLKATDFGLAVEAPTGEKPADSTTMSKAGNVVFANGWAALNNAWGSSGLVEGKEYWINGITNKADITNGTTFSWLYPSTTGLNLNVLAYPAITFGVSPYAPTSSSLVFPLKVSDIKDMSINYDVSFKGATSGFNVAFDIWFTSEPRGDSSTITNELMIWVHKGSMEPFGTVVGTYTYGDFSATIYRSGTYTAFVTDKDIPEGSINLADIMAKMTDLGILNPNEYLAYVELGSEVSSGSGSLTIKNLDMTVVRADGNGGTVVESITGAGVETIPQKPDGPISDFTFVAGSGQSLNIIGVTDHDHLTVDFSAAKRGVTVEVSGGDGRIDIDGGLTYRSVEAFKLIGSKYDDMLIGGTGDDHLIGGAGNDTLRGGDGVNILDGGAGDDRYVIMNSTSTIVEESGNDFVMTYADYTIHSGIETVGLMQAGLTVTGNAEDNRVWGSAGRDIIYGMGGNDYIGAKDGNDLVRGGDGNDTIFGDSGDDELYGDSGDDYLFGGEGNDHLYGGEGSDRLAGGDGWDILDGGAGNDFYYVTDAYDTIIEAIDGGNDTVTATLDYTLTDNLEILALQGNGLTGTGNALANTISGTAGADRLFGMAGADTLIGGAGADQLTGGIGADNFRYDNVWESTRTSQDQILDFTFSEGDRIVLTKIDAKISTAVDDAFAWIGANTFSHTAGELRYSVVNGNSILEGDVNGDGIADLSILLKGVTSMDAGYFQL